MHPEEIAFHIAQVGMECGLSLTLSSRLNESPALSKESDSRKRSRFRQGRQAGSGDDRCHPSQGAPYGSQPAQKGPVPRRIGRTKGGLNSKLHATCDGKGRPLAMRLSEGQMSDYKGAALMIDAVLEAKALLADRGYDAA